MVYQLIYGSSEASGITQLELSELLRKARVKNARKGITGMLLYHDHCFLQILEGDREAVEALFERISLDTRHAGITVFSRGTCAEREFGDWSMAFHAASDDEVGENRGFKQIRSLAPGEMRSSKVRVFMKAFRELTRLNEPMNRVQVRIRPNR
jgi:hypothetical protein